jgi:integrase/recombinase XerD
MNPLRKAMRDYLTMRRSLGFKLAKHGAALPDFVSFLEQKHSSHITTNLALEWATQNAKHTPWEWAARLSIVRGFARHWSATDSSTEVPPLGLLCCRPPRAQPYFYSDHEIRELLQAAKARPSMDPLRPHTYYCLFGLLAVTGLRLGEALKLQADDMNWPEGILTIRGAKFGKSRLVPLHASTCKVLGDYAKRRDRRFGPRPQAPFLVNNNGNRLDKGEVHRVFYSLSRQIGLRAEDAHRGPRLHDFRQNAESGKMPNGALTIYRKPLEYRSRAISWFMRLGIISGLRSNLYSAVRNLRSLSPGRKRACLPVSGLVLASAASFSAR